MPENMEITAEQLKPLLERDEILLLDVREPFEVAAGMIPGAQHIPLGQLPMRYEEVATDRPVVVYCAHGIRSFQGAWFLRTKGFEESRSLAGGIAHWSGAGGQVVPPTRP